MTMARGGGLGGKRVLPLALVVAMGAASPPARAQDGSVEAASPGADLAVSLDPDRYLAVPGVDGTEVSATARLVNRGPADAHGVSLVLLVEGMTASDPAPSSADARCASDPPAAIRCDLGIVPANGPPKMVAFRFRAHPGGKVVAAASAVEPDPEPADSTTEGAVFEAPRGGGSGGCGCGAGGAPPGPGAPHAAWAVLTLVLARREFRRQPGCSGIGQAGKRRAT